MASPIKAAQSSQACSLPARNRSADPIISQAKLTQKMNFPFPELVFSAYSVN
jgi:hypothetical protein